MSLDTQTFDYIVVGAGSAGCIVAARLSERESCSVLLLEAGARGNDWLIKLPIGVGKIWNLPKYNWSYHSEPEPHADNRSLFHPRGRVVGGSGAINMMAYVRGHRGDFDRWAQKGLVGWSYEDVLPWFRKSEKFLSGADDHRGGDGPLNTRVTPVKDILLDRWMQAGETAGLGTTPDYNGATQEGLARAQVNIGDGRRNHSAHAFLEPALRRGNIKLETSVLVERIVVEKGIATAVDYLAGDERRRAAASAEIILCAGAYNTPQILMRSGIGPGEHLREFGIDVVSDDAGVGSNLQDHPAAGMEFELLPPSAFEAQLRYDRLTFNMVRAALLRSGPATEPLFFGTGFVRSRPDLELPDLQLFFRRYSSSARPWFPPFVKPGPRALGFNVCHLRPESRGSVRLSAAGAHAPPRIVNNFLSTGEDRRALREGIRILRRIAAQPAFEGLRGPPRFPADDIQTDEDIDAYVRQALGTVYHPCGTCRMGADPQSVVDPQLRSRDIGRLRIADASVFPDIVGGNINACTMMVAERCADFVKRPE